MKNFKMSDEKGNARDTPTEKSRTTDAAFDMWLTRGLHQIFDDVMNEPIPPELLKILLSDNKK